MKVYGAILVCVALASSCLCIDLLGLAPLAAGTAAPAFTLTSTAGETVSLSDFAGKVVLLNFWTST
jgi:cytochrome oxidase Cu insertion factor (SCO1/SenC/PrrC family)